MSNFDSTDVALPGWFTPILRNVLALVSGFVIAKGWFTAEQWVQIGGGITAAAGAIWTLYSRAQTRKKLKEAIAAPAGLAK